MHTFQFANLEPLAWENDPIVLVITASYLDGIKCNVVPNDYEFSDVELNRIYYVLQYGEFDGVSWQLDGALIEAMRHAVDPNENWQGIDNDFLEKQNKQSN